MRAHAAAFLSDVEARPDSPEAGVAHRVAGITHWFAGEYREARDHLERALALFQPGRDDDLAFRFGQDAGVAAMLYLGDCVVAARRSRSRDFPRRPRAGADRGPSPMSARSRSEDMHAAMFELMRGDRARAAPNAFELARLAREHDLPMWRAFGVFLEGWATAAERRARRRARGHASRRRAAARTERSAVRRALEDRAGRGRGPGRRSRPRRRDPRRSAGDVRPHSAIARSKRNCIGCAAKCCSSATPPTPRPRRKPS